MFPADFPLPSRVPRGHRIAILALLLLQLAAAALPADTGERSASSGQEPTPAAIATPDATAGVAPAAD